MNVEHLRQRFPDEQSCRRFFETVLWPDGPVCPHCHGQKSWRIDGESARDGLLECATCRQQFTVTTKTPFHATKLTLWMWIQAMYSLVNSSKGVSSVYVANWLGVSQKTAWRMLHVLRLLMATYQHSIPKLSGVVELDEKYIGGKPRYRHGIKHKRGRGTAKSCIATAVQRQGPVKAAPVVNDSLKQIKPFVEQRVSSQAHLMTDEHSVYRLLAPGFADHQAVSHGKKEFARGPVHNNTAESFHATLERALQGVYHYMSKLHLSLYTTEAAFRWNQRRPVEKTLKRGHNKGQKRIVMERLPLLDQFANLLRYATGTQLRRSSNGGINILPNPLPLFGL